jgi:hypothetical protein
MRISSTVGNGCMCRLRPTVSGMNTKSSSRRTNRNYPIAA